MFKSTFAAFAFILSLCPAQSIAQGSGLCPGLTGRERTVCLRQEANRTSAQAAYDNAYLASLTNSMQKACRAAEAADFAAEALMEGKTKQVVWAGRTWMIARALSDAALPTKRECDKLRRELRKR